jgi:hypothetical protein
MIPKEWLNFAPQPRPLKEGEKWHVFLSYRSVNRIWVLNLYDILAELGYKVFMDQYVLTSGDDLILRLNDALKASQAGILIWSQAAADSAWVYKEYERLDTKSTRNPDFKFVPVRLDAAELPEFADNKIFQDFSSYPDGPNGGELIRLLYGIVGRPLDAATVHFAAQQDEAAKETILEINAAVRNADPEDIIQLAGKDTLPWRTTPALGCKAAESLIKMKKNDEAMVILQRLQDNFPKAVRPKQLYALALARVGAASNDKKQKEEYLKQAQRILALLYERGEKDPETLGIYARTWMDRYNLTDGKNQTFLEQSRNYYAEAFRTAPDDYYTGINAASKSILLGTPEDMAMGLDLAEQTKNIVKTEPWPNDYWKTATVAEVQLIEKNYKKAGEMYAAAIRMEPGATANHDSSRDQAVKLLAKLGANEEERLQVLASFGQSKL